MISVWVEPAEKSKALSAKLGLTFPLGCDTSLDVIRAYGVEDAENGIAWPAIFIIAPDGTVRWRSLTENYTVRPAAQVVLEALDAAKL